jgi:hypothetical protein
MTFSEAQLDMHRAYFSGAPGMLVSAAVWSTAGMVALLASSGQAVWTLFIGAAFIHPVSVLLAKLLGRSGKHAKGNPLSSLAFATTVWLILSCALAYGVSLHRIEWFFPAMLCVIGGRYLTFATLYGMRAYWACGLTLVAAAYGLLTLRAAPTMGAFTGAAVEAGFAIFLFIQSRGMALHPEVKVAT